MNLLLVQPCLPHQRQILMPRLLQEKSVIRRTDQIIENPFSHQRKITAVLLLHRQHITGLLGIIQLRNRKIIRKPLLGNLYPKHAVYLPLIPQRQ